MQASLHLHAGSFMLVLTVQKKSRVTLSLWCYLQQACDHVVKT